MTSGRPSGAGPLPGDGKGISRHGLKRSPFWPPNWPIRWKLTAVSAGLTFIVLVTFGAVIGQLAVGQLRNNFEADTTSKAEELVDRLQAAGVMVTPGYAGPTDALEEVLKSTSGVAELITVGGDTIRVRGQPDLGIAGNQAGVASRGGYQVATAAIFDRTQDATRPVGWIRYGRPIARLESSVGRMWTFIVLGIGGATLLAALGAAALSRRSLRPISTLTTTARRIARTRDPEVTLEKPVTDDEVAELTNTFSEMLHELSLSRTERERLLGRQREFVADASHELRTPLTSVLANLELLEASLQRDGNEADAESVESALRSSRRMRRLVEDLQVLARIDALQEASFGPCDLSRVAAEAVAELKPLAERHTLVVDAGEPVPVMGAVDDLHRVAINLIGNAIRHSPADSRIEIRTAADPDTGAATLTVSDDGPGIPEGIRDQIFDRFVRGTGRPRDRSGGKGTGLGLAIVKAITESHGGSVELGESRAGGAEFTVTLPLLSPADDGSGPAQGSITTRANR